MRKNVEHMHAHTQHTGFNIESIDLLMMSRLFSYLYVLGLYVCVLFLYSDVKCRCMQTALNLDSPRNNKKRFTKTTGPQLSDWNLYY